MCLDIFFKLLCDGISLSNHQACQHVTVSLNISLTDFIGNFQEEGDLIKVRSSIYCLFHSSMSNCNLKMFVINCIMAVL